MFKRALVLPPSGSETFFLWGPRQTVRSTLLRAAYPDGRWIDLLKADEYRRYASRPELLRQEIEAEGAVRSLRRPGPRTPRPGLNLPSALRIVKDPQAPQTVTARPPSDSSRR